MNDRVKVGRLTVSCRVRAPGPHLQDTGVARRTSHNAYYVSRRVAGWLLRCVFRLTTRRKRAHAYLLALQG